MPNMNTFHGSKMPLLTALARPFLMFKDALSLGEDCWTWTTAQGRVFEDVVLVKLDRHEVTIRHKYGVATIGRNDLSLEVQKSLNENFEMCEPDVVYNAMGDQDHFLHAMPMAHAK
jgi:hypothetical protein